MSRSWGVPPVLLAAIVVACHSEASTEHAGAVQRVVAPVPTAAALATSYGLELQPAVADGVPIHVVDAASGKPVEDALVVSVDE